MLFSLAVRLCSCLLLIWGDGQLGLLAKIYKLVKRIKEIAAHIMGTVE